MKWIYDDGGREQAGFKGVVGDCACRSIAIATGVPYIEVYNALNKLAKKERIGKRKKSKSNSRTGVYMQTIKAYLDTLGWKWVATMKIGTGCKVHLKENELPESKLIVRVSKHITSIVDGVIHDTHDPQRGGTRCVYGYWFKENQNTGCIHR